MAPCSNTGTASTIQQTTISKKCKIKLRKPFVEKMRRNRINSCIEQLKVILEREFRKQEPNSKLEKADILEMTVSFLRQQLCKDNVKPACTDSVHLLPAEPTVSPSLSLQQQQDVPLRQASTHRDISCSCRGPVWRPW